MGIISFILGIVVLAYFSTFVGLAILRIATGISIQRLGYFSLRHIAYTPRDGVRIDLRAVRAYLHRPTFGQPTWITLRLTELKVTVDIQALAGGKDVRDIPNGRSADGPSCALDTATELRPKTSSSSPARSQTWRRLTQVKEKIKKLHDKIQWLCMVDVEVLNSSFVITDIASVQIGTLTMAVDTRRKTVDRGRLFRHKKIPAGEQRPVEWTFVVKSVLFTPEAKESLELIDISSLNVHGLLYKDLPGLRDASISLKLGRIHVPYDNVLVCQSRIKNCFSVYNPEDSYHQSQDISLSDVVEELDMPGSREESIVQTVSDSKEFISSLLRGVQEIQLAISFIGMSKEIRSIKPNRTPLYLNLAMNEFGIDLYRLDQKSPAHRMYFSPKDIAHQALLAAISISVSVDDGESKPERLLYVPMVTMTVKTTLPSKTITISEDRNAAERNANILFANFVVTSPSVDLDLKHMPVVLALLQSHNESHPPSKSVNNHSHHLISRLLPKASIKLSIQEPVARFVLPLMDSESTTTDEYDMLISSISSISLEMESSHSSTGDLHYGLTSNLRISSQEFYYQTALRDRHNLLSIDAFELKIKISAVPELYMMVSGNVQTFVIHMVRPEISKGIHHIVQQYSNCKKPETSCRNPSKRSQNFLRRLPISLVHVQLQGSNFGIQLAGIDPDVSKDLRGIALQVESWNAEYKIHKDMPFEKRQLSSRGGSSSLSGDELPAKVDAPTMSPRKYSDDTDGRRLALHVKGFEGFVVEGVDTWETEPFISIPRFEVAFSTSSDARGQIVHLNSHVKVVHVQYSLYRYYVIGVANTVLQEAFASIKSANSANRVPNRKSRTEEYLSVNQPDVPTPPELLTIDVKTSFVEIKAMLPADPSMMLHIYGLEAGRHRWAVPFMKSRLIRLYVEAPKLQSAWARIMSLKHFRVDFRESKRKTGKQFVDEKSIDIASDFIRLAVPHQLVLHKVFDNLANTLKAVEQLHHRFETRTNEYILRKPPVRPMRIPRISIRSKALMFQMEDGLMDWKLGIIYRVGLIEQKQRLAREEAFGAKMKKLDEISARRGSSRHRALSAHTNHRGRSMPSDLETERKRSKSGEGRSRPRSSSRSHFRGRKMRYDPDSASGLTGAAEISIEQAWNKLQEFNAQSWRKRVSLAMHQQRSAMRDIRSMFFGDEELPDISETSETIVAMPDRPGLMSTLISDLHIVIDKPSFPLDEYSKFLYNIGKGMPHDMEYSLLIPMNLQINMGEARVTLRDYPLPLLHVPAIKPGQSPRLPSWSLKTDFVIAEEYRDIESTKHVRVEVVPPKKITFPMEVKNGFAIDVRRTISPVKTYSDVEIAINTKNPTSMTWGTSYQPAIQDMMQIIESFTKPQVDTSERTGFWDKIRLSVHSRVNVAWKGDGDVHLKLKGKKIAFPECVLLTKLLGSRDPYIITGYGAGFVMCFRNNVRWGIHEDDDPKKFMTVNSGEYVLAIPDYSNRARKASHDSAHDDDSVSSIDGYKSNALFKKTVMKLSGNVRWLAGLVFERDLDGRGRSFGFTPHYDVILKTPGHAKSSNGQVSHSLPLISSIADIFKSYDAFRGFRSQYIHMSIAVIAPLDRDWSVTNLKPSSSYNSVHLTPRFFTHFFDWWSLFSGVMSLPIRQGKLFPGVEKSSKKFGRHIATIKYNLLFSPLFIAHIYKHKDAEEYSGKTVSATGLKLRLSSFMLDLHQRREEFATQGKGRLKQTRTSGMRINQAQLDFISADIRAVSAFITGTSQEDVKRASDEDLADWQQPAVSPDVSRFTIPDHDYLWIDMDDFVELDWILPAERHPETKIMPLAFAPRFTYFRQTDHEETTSGDPNRSSPFGNEPTHFCIMTQDNDPQRVQFDLIKERISVIDEQIEVHRRTEGEQQLRVVRDGPMDSNLKVHLDMLKEQGQLLEEKREFMLSMLQRLSQYLRGNQSPNFSKQGLNNDDNKSERSRPSSSDSISEDFDQAILADFVSDFNNRFIIHNVQLKWNNSLRNIILRYVHQVSQRRGFVYYMSRKAVKFILDIVEEQSKNRQKQSSQQTPKTQPSPSVSFSDEEKDTDLEERIEQLLRESKNFVNADDPTPAERSPKPTTGNLRHNISEEFIPQNSYHVRLIAPQIQLQSEKNSKSALLVTAKSMQLKVIQIMDKTRMADDVSGLVQRRFSVDMDGVQFFVTNQKSLTQFLYLYSAHRYGTPKGSAWPPWVPVEVNFDFNINPFGFARVVQKTSASLRYDKYNTLRLKYNDEVNKGDAGETDTMDDPESRIDHLWVEFPHIRAICDSSQYYAMYLIVADLLLYNEPLEKVRSERLEKIMLAADFSDLTGAPEMVISLQERITQLEEIKGHFQLHAKYLDRQGWQDRLAIEKDLTSCGDELFFMMKAISTSQRKNDDRAQTSQSNGLLRWYLSASEIVWHLMREKNEPLLEIQLNHAAYDRTDNSDGSNNNTMEIQRIRGLNLLPDALYPEMLAPYFENSQTPNERKAQDIKMFKVQWIMLEAIAGIPVLDQFEVNLFPLKVQLEREISKKLFEYIFPGTPETGGASPFMVKHLPPTQDEDEDSDDESSVPVTPSATSDAGDTQSSTRAGSLEIRLRPTLVLTDPDERPRTSVSNKAKAPGVSGMNNEPHRFKLFSNSNRSKSATRPSANRPQSIRTMSRQRSGESLRSLNRSIANASSSNISSMNGSAERPRRFALNRSMSNGLAEKDKASDDLTQMLSRASNYMTLAYVKIPSVVLCLSYKGKGERNIEDVHDFVFRMPALEYRNKTWSNLDLALRLKKDVIKALISHTGAIIGNKFSHHRPSKQQQSRLREIANSSSLLPNTGSLTNTLTRRSTTLHGRSRSSDDIEDTHETFIAGWGTEINRQESKTPSLDDSQMSPKWSRVISPGERNIIPNFSRTRSSTIKSNPINNVFAGPASIPEAEGEDDGKDGVSYSCHNGCV